MFRIILIAVEQLKAENTDYYRARQIDVFLASLERR